MQKPYLIAFSVLDETSIEGGDQVEFVSPLGDQSMEIDREAETAAFVSRPALRREVETKPASTSSTNGGTGRSPFAEAAGLYSL